MAEIERILIADDEETFLYSTADLFRQEGYEVECALDGSTAARMLQDAPYDLLIADIRMPGNPDLQLIQDTGGAVEGMPVILVTGYPSLDTAIQSVQLPVVAYLVKPVEFEELLAKARSSIGHYRAYRSVRSVRRQLELWSEDILKLEHSMQPSASASGLPVQTFLDLTLGNIVTTLLDLKHLTEVLAYNGGEQYACHMLECPRPAQLTEALRETIAVLEKTKSAFKSKELGKLRRRLEDVIQDSEAPEPAQG